MQAVALSWGRDGDPRRSGGVAAHDAYEPEAAQHGYEMREQGICGGLDLEHVQGKDGVVSTCPARQERVGGRVCQRLRHQQTDSGL